jgi:drug/metabolite transporter (DMT)-like permease
MDNRQALDAQAYGLMLFFCLLLGLQQVALKAVATDISPILQISIRSGVAALLLGLVIWFRRIPIVFADGNWKPGILIGILFSLEYLFLGESLRYTSASHAVVFLYTSPIFTVLILHFFTPSERLAPLQWLGILLAFVGIMIAFMGPSSDGINTRDRLIGDTYAILAGASWGLTTALIRTTSISRISSMQTLLYQLVMGAVVLFIAACLMGQTYFNPSPEALISLGFQSIMVSFVALIIWFWLLNRYLASRIGVLSFMTPIIGVVLGAWLLDEPITDHFILGSVCVLAGVVLVSAYGLIVQRLKFRGLKKAVK